MRNRLLRGALAAGRGGDRHCLDLTRACAAATSPEAGPRRSTATSRDAQIAIFGDRELPRMLEQGLPDGSTTTRNSSTGRVSPILIISRRSAIFCVSSTRTTGSTSSSRWKTFRSSSWSATGTCCSPIRRSCSSPLAPRAAPSELDRRDRRTESERARSHWPPSCSRTSERVFVVSGAAEANLEFERVGAGAVAAVRGTTHDHRICQAFRPAIWRGGCGRCPPLHRLLPDRRPGRRRPELPPTEYLDRVAAVANAPVYSLGRTPRWGTASSGGSLLDQAAKTQASPGWPCGCFTANPRTASRWSPPISTSAKSTGGSCGAGASATAHVPAGVLVRFREPSVWDRYRGYILAAVRSPFGADGADRRAARAAE